MKLNDDWFDKFIKFSLAAIVITLITLALIDLLFSTSQVEKLKVTDKYYSSSRKESKPIVLSNGSVGISSDYKPEEASRIANALRDVAAQKIIAVTRVADVTTLEDARPATSPSSPNIRRNTIMGVGAGAGLMILVVLLLELFDDRVKRPEDIEDVMKISLLGVIPDLDKLK